MWVTFRLNLNTGKITDFPNIFFISQLLSKDLNESESRYLHNSCVLATETKSKAEKKQGVGKHEILTDTYVMTYV